MYTHVTLSPLSKAKEKRHENDHPQRAHCTRHRGALMPVPMWVAQVNKRVFNPLELRRGVRPVLAHVGRSSEKTYRTPLAAYPVDGGYIFIVMYGSDSDWVKNVLAAGAATLEIDGGEFELVSPRLVSKEDAWQLLSPTTKAPPNFLRVTDYLQMDVRR